MPEKRKNTKRYRAEADEEEEENDGNEGEGGCYYDAGPDFVAGGTPEAARGHQQQINTTMDWAASEQVPQVPSEVDEDEAVVESPSRVLSNPSPTQDISESAKERYSPSVYTDPALEAFTYQPPSDNDDDEDDDADDHQIQTQTPINGGDSAPLPPILEEPHAKRLKLSHGSLVELGPTEQRKDEEGMDMDVEGEASYIVQNSVMEDNSVTQLDTNPNTTNLEVGEDNSVNMVYTAAAPAAASGELELIVLENATPANEEDSDTTDKSTEGDARPQQRKKIATDCWLDKITPKELAILSDANSMYNDVIMDALAEMLVPMCPGYRYMNSRVFENLLDLGVTFGRGGGGGGEDQRQRTTLFAGALEDAEQVLVTINHVNTHWLLGRASLSDKVIYLYDSLGDQDTPAFRHAKAVMRKLAAGVEMNQQKEQQQQEQLNDDAAWKCVRVPVAQQIDVVSCGVHVIANMLHIMTNTKFLSTTASMDAGMYRFMFKALLTRTDEKAQWKMGEFADYVDKVCQERIPAIQPTLPSSTSIEGTSSVSAMRDAFKRIVAQRKALSARRLDAVIHLRQQLQVPHEMLRTIACLYAPAAEGRFGASRTAAENDGKRIAAILTKATDLQRDMAGSTGADEALMNLKPRLETKLLRPKAIRRYADRQLQYISFGITRIYRALGMLDFAGCARQIDQVAAELRAEMDEAQQELKR